MNARALLSDLRQLGAEIETDGDRLRVDAPAGALDRKLQALLANNKQALIKLLEWEQRKLREADRQGLVIRWAEERGWISLHDPSTGEWHEVRASECLPGVVQAANASRRRKREGGAVRGASKDQAKEQRGRTSKHAHEQIANEEEH